MIRSLEIQNDAVRQSGPRRDGVLLVGHGTRDDQGNAEFFRLADELAQRLDDRSVAPCLLEFQHPTIAEAWDWLVAAGVTHVQTAPLLLFAAGHAKRDIPDAIEACRCTTPRITTDQSGPLSRHPAIVELARQRLRETLDTLPVAPERTAVVMVGRGSYDPCAQADMRLLAELLRHRVSVARVETAFYAMAVPKLPDVIDRIASDALSGKSSPGGESMSKIEAIVVQPHLLFTGRLFEAIGRQCDEAQRRHPGIRVVCSRYLGPDPLVAEAIADRINSGTPAAPGMPARHR